MSDELKQAIEDMKSATADARKLNEKMEQRLADGAGAGVKREEVEKALAEATRAAQLAEDVEKKYLAQSTRRVFTDLSADKATVLRDESAMLGQYVQTGKLSDDSSKVMRLSMGTDNSTGHYVIMPPTMAADILQLLREYSPMEQICDVQTIEGTEWKQVKFTSGGSAGRVSERGTRSETNTPSLGDDTIKAHGYYAYPTVTQEQLFMVKDFDLGAFVMNDANLEMQELVEADYLTGTGVGRPFGLLANTTLQAAAKVTGSATGLGTSFDPLKTMTGAIHESFLPNARWMMRRATEVAISLLKGGDGKYLWQPSIDANVPNMLFGYPVNYNGYMPQVADYATNPYVAAFGDFRQGYKIVISRFMLLIRDEVTSPGYVKMYKEIKKGGDVRRTEAISLLKIAAS